MKPVSKQTASLQFFTRALLRWYRAFGRDLPWRKTTDPYAIWVSEIMLQQTQVATALPYYRRFLSAFPTVQDLAAASLDKVLKSWEGLGYYARARNLHRAAKELVDVYNGIFPSTFEEVLSLPGVGRSTAGAILTIGFGQSHPILDGNVRRVLCRYFCVEEDPRGKKTEERLWRYSESLLPKRNAAAYTQAIMDLGATICTPSSPQCSVCPLNQGCLGYQKGLQEKLPLRGAAKVLPHRDYLAAVIRRGEKVLIGRRPLKGLLGGLWEFPGGRSFSKVGADGEAPKLLEKELGFQIQNVAPWMEVRHVFTHFRMTLRIFVCQTKIRNIPSDLKWVSLKELDRYPFSSAHQKIVLKLTGKERGQGELF